MFSGWYPDESGLPFERYWDGTHWTADVRPLSTQPASPAGYPAYSTAPLPSVPPRRQAWYRRRGVVIAGAVIAGIIVISSIASALAPKKNDAGQTPNAAAAVDTPPPSVESPKHHVRAKSIQRPHADETRSDTTSQHTNKQRPPSHSSSDGS